MMQKFYIYLAQVSIDSNDLRVPKPKLTENSVQNVIRLAFGFAGAIAVLMVTIAGFKYVLSQGNPQETAKAKNTILYALIGLVVCLIAVSAVTYFMNKVG